MNDEVELEHWGAEWRVTREVPPDTSEAVKRAARREQIWAYAELAATAILGGIATIWAVDSGEPAMRFLAVWTWSTLIFAWILLHLTNRDNWSGAAPDTEAFLERRIRGRRAALRIAKIGCVLYALELLIGSALVQAQLGTAMLVVWIGSALFLVWTCWYARARKAEIVRLLQIWQSTEENDVLSKRKKRTVLGGLIESPFLFPSQFEAFDLRLRRNNKLRKT